MFFFFNDTATTEIYTLSLHDALPISPPHEHRPTVARSHAPHRVSLAVVAAQRASRMAADRDEPLLLPLPAHFHLVRDEVHVVLVQPRQFGQTDAPGVEQLEHGEGACFPEPPRDRKSVV